MRALSGKTAGDAASAAGRLLQRLPGAGYAKEQLGRAERRLLEELRQRLDSLGPLSTRVSVVAVAMRGETRSPHALGTRMQELLGASMEQSREEAEQSFLQWVMGNLVPDQARILAALSDGSTYPLIHVYGGTLLGPAEPVLECVCSVGKNAGVLWPETTHVYVQQLRAFGLVETGPEDPSRRVQYEMLETEQSVRDALARLQKGGLRPQMLRRVLQMSEIGKKLWAECRIGED